VLGFSHTLFEVFPLLLSMTIRRSDLLCPEPLSQLCWPGAGYGGILASTAALMPQAASKEEQENFSFSIVLPEAELKNFKEGDMIEVVLEPAP
jgi:hypothetical protein